MFYRLYKRYRNAAILLKWRPLYRSHEKIPSLNISKAPCEYTIFYYV